MAESFQPQHFLGTLEEAHRNTSVLKELKVDSRGAMVVELYINRFQSVALLFVESLKGT